MIKRKSPDVALRLPPVAAANVRSVRDALIESTKALIAAGYEPAILARALIGTGASLAVDLGGEAYALGELDVVAAAVRAPQNAPSDVHTLN